MLLTHCYTDYNINPAEATPKTIMRTMGVKGLTLFHLKSHLQVLVIHLSHIIRNAALLLSLLLIPEIQIRKAIWQRDGRAIKRR
jgi:hypothetical protein